MIVLNSEANTHHIPWLNEFKDIDDKRLLWDLIKYRIIQVTITYSKKKAPEKREKISEIEASLKISEEKTAVLTLLMLTVNTL